MTAISFGALNVTQITQHKKNQPSGSGQSQILESEGDDNEFTALDKLMESRQKLNESHGNKRTGGTETGDFGVEIENIDREMKQGTIE